MDSRSLRVRLVVICGLAAGSLGLISVSTWDAARSVVRSVPALADDADPQAIERYDAEVRARETARGTAATSAAGLAGLTLATVGYARARAAERQVELARQSEITSQYGQAIDQLGAEKPSVRLGGVYTLRRLATQGVSHRRTVSEVLSGFIREGIVGRADDHIADGDKGWWTLPVDVEAALHVLVELKDEHGEIEIDLRKVDLRRVDLSSTDVSGVNLRNAKLSKAALLRTDLSNADLVNVDLSGALMMWANLSHTNLTRANLIGADTTKVNVTGADLTGVKRK